MSFQTYATIDDGKTSEEQKNLIIDLGKNLTEQLDSKVTDFMKLHMHVTEPSIVVNAAISAICSLSGLFCHRLSTPQMNFYRVIGKMNNEAEKQLGFKKDGKCQCIRCKAQQETGA